MSFFSKEYYKEPIEWENPVKKTGNGPYFGDVIFPGDPRVPAAAESLKVLREFYCESRKYHQSDLSKLKAYLASPNEPLFIVEGEVGIGKTWYMRYHLTQQSAASAGQPGFTGVVDLLRAGPERAIVEVYSQICPILELYFFAVAR
jgi:predicted ATPase